MLTKYQPVAWVVTTGIAFLFLNLLLVSVGYLFLKGIGIWGNNVPVGWAFDIINFVWWIGIGHAGTLISAILLLLKQDWRTSINRFAEAMTLFAVACALMFPLIHTGRPWLAAYWLLPYPNSMGIWPQFRSPLIWDVFAVSTYGTVSLLFWYTGLIPDLATMRDRAKNKVTRYIYGGLALGWRGSARHWQRYENAYLLLAGMSTPLVLSVHTVVSFDFSVGIIPGWHTTIFPPYFVAGAIYAGFAMVLTLAIPLRRMFGFEDFITMRHLENMAKVTLVTGLIVVYGYAMEVFFGYYSANQYREVHDPQPDVRALRLVVLDADLLQRHRPADAVDQEPAHQHDLALHHVAHRQRRHVAGALRDHRHVAAPRLPAVVVGDVLPDVLGFLDLLRHHRPVRDADVPLRAGAADDLHLRGADAAARGEGERRGGTLEPCSTSQPLPQLYGLMAEFDDANALVDATRRTYAEGYRKMDAYSPFPIEPVWEAMDVHDRPVSFFVLCGGIVGMIAGFGLCYWVSTMAYPLNVGGRPFNSWPSFIPVTFELTILLASFAAVISMLALNGLPMPYHPVFNVPSFARASQDKFFLAIEAADPKFDRARTLEFMKTLGARRDQ